MKLLITGDWQLEDGPSLDHLDDGGKSIRFQEHVAHIRGILDAGITEGCELMVHLGDLTEHSNPRSTESDAAAKLFSHWIKPNYRRVLAAVGNHDGKIFDISSSSFAPLARMSSGDLVAPHVPYSYPLPIEGVNLVVLPYMHGKTVEEVKAALGAVVATLREGTRNYLFMHYGVSGVALGPKNLVLPSDHLPADALFLDSFEAVFCGHIHKQQIVTLTSPKGRKVQVYLPGSPAYCDFGERNDNKGYIILDTKTGKVDVRQVTPKRAWVQAEWPIDWPPLNDAPWKEGDIVKVAGTHPRGMDARAEFAALLELGLPKPFALAWAVVPEAAERVARSEDVSGAGSLLDAATELGHQLYPDDPYLDEALKLVADKLREGQKPPIEGQVNFHSLDVTDFMTYGRLKLDDMDCGEPTLVSGPNGLGKTNMMEAMLFALSGKTSKGLNIGDLVRQGQKKALVTAVLGGAESVLTIERSISKNAKTGAGTQKLTVRVETAEKDDYTLDGTLAEVQRSLDEMLGVSYPLLKTANFMFQKDPSPFTKAEPGDRKKVMADALCLEPVLRAYKLLNESRLIKQRAFHDAKAALTAVNDFKPVQTRQQLEQELQNVAQAAQEAQEQASAAEVTYRGAQAAETASYASYKAAQDELWTLPDPGKDLAAAKATLAADEDSLASYKANQLVSFRAVKAKLAALVAPGRVHLDPLRSDIAAASKALVDLEAVQNVRRQEVNKAASANAVAVTVMVTAEKLVAKLTATQEGSCSQCGQAITEAHLEDERFAARGGGARAQKDVETTAGAVREANRVEQEATIAVVAQRKVVTDLTAELNTAELYLSQASSLDEQMKSLVAQTDAEKARYAKKALELAAKIDTLTYQVAEADKKRAEVTALVTSLQVQQDTLVAERLKASNVKDEKNRSLGLLQGGVTQAKFLLSEMERWEQQVREVEKRIAETEKNSRVADMACAIVDPKGGLPVYLVDSRLPFLEERINVYMDLLGMPDLRVSLSTVEGDKETLSVLVDNGMEPRLDIRAFSGGQLDRVEVAIKMAMADLAETIRGSNLGLLCYDEPTGGLDTSGKEALAAILFDKAAKKYPATFIVSHDPSLAESFVRRLRVSKAADGSTIIT